MKRIYILPVLLFITTRCLATSEVPLQNKVSPNTMFFLNDLTNVKGVITPALANKYCLVLINGTYYAGGLMMVDKNSIDEAVSTWNAKIGTRAGNVFTVKIPVNNFTSFLQEPAVTYFELDKKVYLKLDSVRSVTGVDLVQQGYNLPQGYSGKGVVFGDVDAGFDYTHPMFFDSTGTVYRVKRVWEEGNNTGTSPAEYGFGYGTEYTSPSAILAKQFSDSSESHGSHVSGIAAGSGGGTHGRYRGMAFEADLVFVDFTILSSLDYVATDIAGTTTGIIDGISYIYQYAQSVNEPAVVNLSLGSHLGPHDGTSLFDVACDNMLGLPGMILVGAAGNEGSTSLHYGNNFNTDTATKFSYVSFEGQSGFGVLDAWGAFSTDFCLNFHFASNSTSTGRLCASKDYNGSQTLVVTSASKDTCFIQVTSTSGTGNSNSEPEILVFMQNDQWYKGDTLVIEISAGNTGYNGTVNIWNDGYGNGNPFWGTSSNPNFFDGDDHISVGEIGGTGKSIISVGAFTSKNTFTNYTGKSYGSPVSGNVGAIASFSSMGPTVDGRIKPDIAAPGNTVVSSINSFDPDYCLPSSPDSVYVVDTIHGNRLYAYAILQGTSMATPCVGGIAALLLQFNPSLTQSEMKTVLEDNAIRDQNVLSAGSAPNNVWGNGKVNAYEVMRAATPVNNVAQSQLLVYPNPSQNYVTIVSNGEPLQAQLYDIAGREVLSTQMSGNVNRLDVSAFSKGVYLLKVQQADKVYCEKLVVE